MSKQLDKELAKLTTYKVDENHYRIDKDATIRIIERHQYVIQLHDCLFDPNSLLAINWNKGRLPKCRFYKIDIIQILQNMIKVNAVGYNYNPMQVEDVFNGWFPLDDVDVISEI